MVHGGQLYRRSVSLCRSMGLGDFVEDAVQQTAIRLLARGGPIADRGAHSALRYTMRVLRGVCVDEWRLRGRERAAGGLARQADEDRGGRGDDLLDRLSRQADIDLEAVVDARRSACAIVLCFEYLPVYADPAHRSAARNLQAFWLGCVDGLSESQIARALGIEQANRTMRARGKRLLLGWHEALAGDRSTCCEQSSSYRAAWQVGFDAGRAFVADQPSWWARWDDTVRSGHAG